MHITAKSGRKTFWRPFFFYFIMAYNSTIGIVVLYQRQIIKIYSSYTKTGKPDITTNVP